MKAFFKVFIWIANVVMTIVLLVNLAFLYGYTLEGNALPKNMDEISAVSITVKTAIVSSAGQMITPIEYPTQFGILGQLSNLIVEQQPIKPGDKIEVYLKKSDAQSVQRQASKIMPLMIGYGITLPNGGMLVDPKDVLSGKIQKDKECAAYKVISVPILYFLILIFFPIIRKKYTRNV